MDWKLEEYWFYGLDWTGLTLERYGLKIQFPITCTKWAIDHVLWTRHAFACHLGPAEKYLCNSFTSLVVHERNSTRPMAAPACKLATDNHRMDERLKWNEKTIPVFPMLLLEHGNVSASKVVRQHRIVKHILDRPFIHGIGHPNRKHKSNPKGMKHVPNHVPPSLKVTLRKAPCSMLIALCIWASVDFCTEATWKLFLLL